jgi:hypothetical protein
MSKEAAKKEKGGIAALKAKLAPPPAKHPPDGRTVRRVAGGGHRP